jgi:hypothetical protein
MLALIILTNYNPITTYVLIGCNLLQYIKFLYYDITANIFIFNIIIELLVIITQQNII